MDSPRNPYLAVDIIAHPVDCTVENMVVAMVRRKNPPHGWAIVGGFVNYGESLADAAEREFEEETKTKVKLLRQMHAYSRPDRDPRQHTVSVCFIGTVPMGTVLVGADDAAEARFFNLEDMCKTVLGVTPGMDGPIVFDHLQVLRDYRTLLLTGNTPGIA